MLIAATSGVAAPLAAAHHTEDPWKACTETALRNYALTSNVPAPAVVEAALGACQDKFRTGVETPRTQDRQPLIDEASRDTAYKTMVDQWRPQLVEGVLKIRKDDQARQ